jgi:hypothetical protein
MNKLALAALALAACNTSQSGNNDRVAFTPTNCGVIGCNFADGIGVFGRISVQISGIDGQPTAGLDLASTDTAVLSVERQADIGGAPAWELTAHAPGVVDLAALDAGTEIDFITVDILDVVALHMNEFVGDIVEQDDPEYDQWFTVDAGEQVSWLIRPVTADEEQPMGRFDFQTVTYEGAPDVTQYELENSDRPTGHLSVNLEVGDYPVEFRLTEAFEEIYVTALISAVAPL